MAVKFRSRNQVLLVKVQAAKGTAETPTVGSNAVKVQFPIPWTPQLETLDTNYAQDGLDQSEHIVGGGMINLKPSAFLKGSGSGGTAPDYGALLRGCAMSETLLASAATGTAQAGAASTITLAAGASSVNDAYKGMPIRITGGAGSGMVNIISAYNGSTKVATVAIPWASLPSGTAPDNTSTYSIDACALYRPISLATEVVTAWRLQHDSDGTSNSLRDRAFDCAGGFSLQLAPGKLGTIAFDLRGRFVADRDDYAYPGAATFQSQAAEALLGAQIYLGSEAIKFTDLRFDIGAQAAMFPDASDSYGMDTAEVIGRQPSGQITPNMVSVATRNTMQDWRQGNTKQLWVRWGSATGKRVSLWWPSIKYTGDEGQDLQGYAGQALPFRTPTLNGALYMCIH